MRQLIHDLAGDRQWHWRIESAGSVHGHEQVLVLTKLNYRANPSLALALKSQAPRVWDLPGQPGRSRLELVLGLAAVLVVLAPYPLFLVWLVHRLRRWVFLSGSHVWTAGSKSPTCGPPQQSVFVVDTSGPFRTRYLEDRAGSHRPPRPGTAEQQVVRDPPRDCRAVSGHDGRRGRVRPDPLCRYSESRGPQIAGRGNSNLAPPGRDSVHDQAHLPLASARYARRLRIGGPGRPRTALALGESSPPSF